MQAISTKYLGPTDTKDGRVKATTASKISVTVPYDDSLEPEQAHRVAAIALIKKLNWPEYSWIGGSTPTGYVFVQSIQAVTPESVMADIAHYNKAHS